MVGRSAIPSFHPAALQASYKGGGGGGGVLALLAASDSSSYCAKLLNTQYSHRQSFSGERIVKFELNLHARTAVVVYAGGHPSRAAGHHHPADLGAHACDRHLLEARRARLASQQVRAPSATSAACVTVFTFICSQDEARNGRPSLLLLPALRSTSYYSLPRVQEAGRGGGGRQAGRRRGGCAAGGRRP